MRDDDMQIKTGPLFRSRDDALSALKNITDGFRWKVIPSRRKPGWWTIVGEM